MKFELRVVCMIKSHGERNCPSQFDAISHGNGFQSWWKQERNEKIATQCKNDDNIFHDIQAWFGDIYFLQYIQVYVRIGEDECDKRWRMKLFESFGGKTHI